MSEFTNLTNTVYITASYLLTPWSRVLLEKLTSFQLVKKFPALYGTPKVHYRINKCLLPVPVLCQLDQVHTPHPISLRYILILPSHPCLRLPSGLFPSGFLTKTLHTPLLSSTRATCPAHLFLLNIIT